MTDEFAKTVIVTRRALRQKEVTVSMTDGRYGKNEVIVHLTGLEPNYELGQAVKEASEAMTAMQERNPLFIGITSKTSRLPAEKELPP